MLRVCVIFGGASSEYDVSLRSASCVIENLDKDKYEIIMLGITRRGKWLLYTGPVDLILSGEWDVSPYTEPAILSPDSDEKGIILLGKEPPASFVLRRSVAGGVEKVGVHEKDFIRVLPVDVVFPVLHGKNGEDGTIQGLLELAEIPYVGCGVLSSAACMDKEFAHVILKNAGVTKTELVALRHNDLMDFEKTTDRLEEEIGYPMFVKPANAGSSVGISKVSARADLYPAVNLAFEHDTKIVVEKAVKGREIECAVWGNEYPNPSYAMGEILPTRNFYDYEGKYLDDSVNLIAPAELDEETTEDIRDIAVLAYTAMECRGLARIDFFIKEDNSIVLNEINTLPGFTSISMFPILLQEDGMTLPEIVDNLIECAMQ